MIEFMKSNYYDPYVAQYIKPKKEFKVKLKDADKDFIFDESEADLNKFDLKRLYTPGPAGYTDYATL